MVAAKVTKVAEHRFSWASYDDLLTHQQLQARDLWGDVTQVRARYFLDRDGNVLSRRLALASGVDAICCATIADCDPDREEVTKMPISWWRKLVAFVSGAGMVAVMLAGEPVEAQMAPRCMPMSLLVKELATKYGEQHIGAVTYQSDGSWRFLYANVRNFISVQPATYTIFDLRSGGMACIVETGKNVSDWVIAAALGRGVA